jgi:fermentation-respiration switch protein FrsA (DUF1100 family)
MNLSTPRRRKVRNLVIFFFVLLFIIATPLLVIVLAQAQARALVYPARGIPMLPPSFFGIENYETVRFLTEDGVEIAAWYIPPREVPGAALIYVHGFGSNRGEMLEEAADIHTRLGYGALLIDMRNHSESGGSITTLGLNEVRDVQAAFAWLQTQPAIDAERIGLIGVSMGGATVLRAMARLPEARLVVAQAAYSTLEENIAEGVEGLTIFPAFPFAPLIVMFGEQEAGLDITSVRPIDDVPAIAPRPLLFMHGTADTLVLPRNSEAMYAAAGEPKQIIWVEGAGHGGLYAWDRTGYHAQVLPFLERYLGGS